MICQRPSGCRRKMSMPGSSEVLSPVAPTELTLSVQMRRTTARVTRNEDLFDLQRIDVGLGPIPQRALQEPADVVEAALRMPLVVIAQIRCEQVADFARVAGVEIPRPFEQRFGNCRFAPERRAAPSTAPAWRPYQVPRKHCASTPARIAVADRLSIGTLFVPGRAGNGASQRGFQSLRSRVRFEHGCVRFGLSPRQIEHRHVANRVEMKERADSCPRSARRQCRCCDGPAALFRNCSKAITTWPDLHIFVHVDVRVVGHQVVDELEHGLIVLDVVAVDECICRSCGLPRAASA